MKSVFNFLSNIVSIKTTIYKEGGSYVVKDEMVLFGMVVGADTRKASEVVK